MMAYLHNMENGLIAKDINNNFKKRKNLSLKYENEQGKILGYLFAYEGEDNENPIIYITDLAADPESKMAGGRLINEFLKLYKKLLTLSSILYDKYILICYLKLV